MPDWDAAVRYAKLAHRACPNFVFIGWDVAFTDQGPMLIEGNENWSAHTYHLLSGEPLGLTSIRYRFGDPPVSGWLEEPNHESLSASYEWQMPPSPLPTQPPSSPKPLPLAVAAIGNFLN